jgi:hypothetical protein
VATDVYAPLASAVKAAGFYTSGVENRGTWDRTTVCSKRGPDGELTGNSFWVTKLPSGWYLGTWGVRTYYLPDESQLADLCIEWLSREPDGTQSDFDQRLKAAYGLVEVTEQSFVRAAGESDSDGETDDERR